MALTKLMTVNDYAHTVETVQPMEIVFGALRMAQAPTPRHLWAVRALAGALDRHVRSRRLGQVLLAPIDVVLDEGHALVVQPDLVFVSSERASIVNHYVHGAPDLIVEVLSPNPRIGRTDERIQWFAECGVRECWLLHQSRREVAVVEFSNRRIASRRLYHAFEEIRSNVLRDLHETPGGLLGDDDRLGS